MGLTLNLLEPGLRIVLEIVWVKKYLRSTLTSKRSCVEIVRGILFGKEKERPSLKEFFKKGMHKYYLDTEFSRKIQKKAKQVEREHSLEEDETEELLKSLSARLAEE